MYFIISYNSWRKFHLCDNLNRAFENVYIILVYMAWRFHDRLSASFCYYFIILYIIMIIIIISSSSSIIIIGHLVSFLSLLKVYAAIY